MHYILLAGAIFNLFGGIIQLASFAALSASQKANPPDYAPCKLFLVGTAFTFSAMYLYLFLNPQYIMPFLIFGMSLKFWVFVVSLLSYTLYGFPKKDLISFGVTNLVVGVLFGVLLLA